MCVNVCTLLLSHFLFNVIYVSLFIIASKSTIAKIKKYETIYLCRDFALSQYAVICSIYIIDVLHQFKF